MVDDDDLWGPPFIVVEDNTFRLLRGCEFWFDCRTDVLEENFQNERYCEIVWRILNEKKQLVEIDVASSSRTGDSRDLGSSDSDKSVSVVVPEADTSSSKSALDEDENTSSISDAQTIEIVDSRNDVEGVDMETRLKPQETAVNDSITVEVAEDVDTSSSPMLANKIEEAEEHSCSFLVTDQVFDPIKQAPENKSLSDISQENTQGSVLTPLVKEKANATNEEGEILKDHGLQDVVTVSEPFTTETLLEMCDEPEKRPHPEDVKTVVKEELIVNFLNEARKKAEKKVLLKNPGSVLTKKRPSKSNISKGMNSSFIRTTKQKVGVEAGESNMESTPKTISEAVISISDLKISDMKNKTGKELRSIAKAMKVTHYYKLKKEDLLQQIILQLTECTEAEKGVVKPISPV